MSTTTLPLVLADALPGLARIDLGGASPGREVWVGYRRDLRGLARPRALLDPVFERSGRD